ncbi:MAG TPA: amino acid adenylation domain-containing protein, partial [Thermoanaerobaculia bacterium]|nr:amino acid adenylation domain-containing protein [Thermoanaerobaculia bacterium]
AEALENRDLPFPVLAGRLQPVRDPGRPPVFQALFTFQSAAPGQEAGLAAFAVGQAEARVDLDGLVLESFPLDRGASQFDVTLSAAEVGDALVFSCEYGTDLFDGVTIERWLGYLQTLLDSAAAQPEQRVGELELLTHEERSELLARGEGPRPTHAGPGLIHELVSEQARRTPDAVAVSGTDEQITYNELVRRSLALAQTLRRLGVAPEVPVGVSMERSPDMVVALLGVLSAGGFYVPLDPSLPEERLAHMMKDCRPAVVLTGGSTPWRLGGEIDLAPGPDPENLAYTIYTSGSTGRPKGVQVSHRAVVNFLRAMAVRPGLRSGDVVPALTTLSFDIAGLEIYLPLIQGGRIEIVSREEAADGRRLSRRISEAGVTVMQATPATWQMLVDSGWPGHPGLKALCGGEALPRELAEDLLARGVELWNVYGPTETAIWSTAGRVAPGPDPVRLGQAIDHTRLFVVDHDWGLAPPGVPGELWIAGDGVARGYLGRPDLTAERFVADRFSGISGARLYRTGDLVRWRGEGDLEFLGRIDHQIKVRGFRIAPGVIEAALDCHPGVARSVAGVQERAGDRRLIAHYVPRLPLHPNDLREFLRASLPEYMVPSAFVPLAVLPLTPSGKVDRKALLAEEWRVEGGHVAPRTPVEEVLAGIWAEVLGIERVGATDHFFDLGGHSLLATRVT